jgi:hypothetical protein
MLHELDAVALVKDLPAHQLKVGDVGTIVHAHDSAGPFEVEFVRADGWTVALVRLEAADIRALDPRDIFNARRMAS